MLSVLLAVWMKMVCTQCCTETLPSLITLLLLSGKGAVYTYDAIGSYDRYGYAVQGAGQAMMIPFLDNVVRSMLHFRVAAFHSSHPMARS